MKQLPHLLTQRKISGKQVGQPIRWNQHQHRKVRLLIQANHRLKSQPKRSPIQRYRRMNSGIWSISWNNEGL